VTRTILITDSDLGPPVIERQVCEEAGYRLVEAQCRTEENVVRAVQDVAPSGLLVQYAPVTARVLSAASSIRAIARYGAGVDSIDVDAASRAGAAVVNVPDYAVHEVADHTLALALLLLRQAACWTTATRSGEWPAPGAESAPLRTMNAIVFGLAGFGRIARAVAERARAFGANVVAHDPFVDDAAFEEAAVQRVSWEVLWATADIVSLHMSLSCNTERVVDAAALSGMRRGSYLVNTARAALVDRAALEAALHAEVLAGVAVDVWWHEPPDADDPLLRDPRVVVTPHVAYLSSESLPRLRRTAAERLVQCLHGNITSLQGSITTPSMKRGGS